ncbi:hypothetical protein N8H22_18565 [Stutzerimonas stutzeri]|uniref:hypothetical protein n=1 Tax=Stutzerimonas sp. S1 TaxID=3030652 RepID=UPI002225B5DC|nr:hypothetical protein [Stutzerimonas sp. S1]MCW3150615.1 hypothetical protein [Stutzerimonas sp. S1]
MPDPEIKEWISLIKDSLLALAALVTIGLGVHGVRVWKRDLVGKEVYSAARELVKQSHVMSSAVIKLRMPISSIEEKVFTPEEIGGMTENERWRISELEAYQKRIEEYVLKLEEFQSARLDLRVLIGSKAHDIYLPFSRHLTDIIHLVNDYLEIIRDFSTPASPDTPNVIEARQALYLAEYLDDDYSQALDMARENGERCLLSYLHRKGIYN